MYNLSSHIWITVITRHTGWLVVGTCHIRTCPSFNSFAELHEWKKLCLSELTLTDIHEWSTSQKIVLCVMWNFPPQRQPECLNCCVQDIQINMNILFNQQLCHFVSRSLVQKIWQHLGTDIKTVFNTNLCNMSAVSGRNKCRQVHCLCFSIPLSLDVHVWVSHT